MAQDRSEIAGSHRAAPDAERIGPARSDDRATVSLYLKRPGALAESGSTPIVGRERLRRDREAATADGFDRIAAFAKSHDLSVVERDPARRLVKLSGRIADLSAAFGTGLELYGSPDGAFRARSGMLTAPADVANLLEAVLGLDQRPIATPKSIRLPAAAAAQAHLPNVVAALYGFPKPAGAGKGECIALIELGGGVATADTAAAFKSMGLAAPKVTAVLVSGGTNQPGKDPDADGEVALDVQVAGGGAPGAAIAVYFAPNTDQGFVDAISQAVHDETNKPSVMSISWGSAESAWTQQAVTAMTSAFQDAAEAGVSVFAASGDGLATDGVSDGKAHVDFPASSPWVVGCGGTRLNTSGARLSGESVWNSNGGGSGGGISALFAVPAYQTGVALPAPVGATKKGRGVPDVAADADPDTGYDVVVDGQSEIIGGTSAAAPLWAGLFALVNAAAGKPVGQPHALLYAHPDAFNDVRTGDNKASGIGYAAGAGWDACTGLGTPRAAAVAALFAAKAT
ncbi:MAG TPA: S53 family peptidase [Caulobacteraceae bacterium]